MLSAEQRMYSNVHQFRNGMRNICWIAGIARSVQPKGGFIQHTPNLNHMIPFQFDSGDSMPAKYGELSEIKIHGRLRGARHPVTGEWVVQVVAKACDAPSVLDLPPESAWAHSVPKGAPTDDFRPKFGRAGLDFSQSSNRAEVAGFISGMKLKKPGVLNEKGEPGNGCLEVLIQQTSNPDDKIPVRLYGPRAPMIASKIKIGSPIYVKDGEVRIRVKETGEPAGEDGIVPVHKYPYIHASMLYVATRKEIVEQPEWALELYRLGQDASLMRRRTAGQSVESAGDVAATPEAEAAQLQIDKHEESGVARPKIGESDIDDVMSHFQKK